MGRLIRTALAVSIALVLIVAAATISFVMLSVSQDDGRPGHHHRGP